MYRYNEYACRLMGKKSENKVQLQMEWLNFTLPELKSNKSYRLLKLVSLFCTCNAHNILKKIYFLLSYAYPLTLPSTKLCECFGTRCLTCFRFFFGSEINIPNPQYWFFRSFRTVRYDTRYQPAQNVETNLKQCFSQNSERTGSSSVNGTSKQ